MGQIRTRIPTRSFPIQGTQAQCVDRRVGRSASGQWRLARGHQIPQCDAMTCAELCPGIYSPPTQRTAFQNRYVTWHIRATSEPAYSVRRRQESEVAEESVLRSSRHPSCLVHACLRANSEILLTRMQKVIQVRMIDLPCCKSAAVERTSDDIKLHWEYHRQQGEQKHGPLVPKDEC